MHKHMPYLRFGLLIALILTQHQSSLAQGIHGYVFGKELAQDAAGNAEVKDLGVVPDAKVELMSSSGVRFGSATTDENGFYTFPSVPESGQVEYVLTADGFRQEDDGRAFELPVGEEDRVVNFSLFKGETSPKRESRPSATISVTVLAMEASKLVPQKETSILLWKSNDEAKKVMVDVPDGKTNTPIQLVAGKWTIMASNSELGMSPKREIELKEGQSIELDITYPKSVRDIRALVMVEVDAAGSSSGSDLPQVEFLMHGREMADPIPTRVNPISDEEQAMLSGGTKTARWFWALPVQPLASDQEYIARATLDGFETAESAVQRVEDAGVKVFNVDLLGSEQLSTLSGTVKQIATEGTLPVPDATIRLEHETLDLVKQVKADASGSYQTKLREGQWWGKVVSAPKLDNLKAVNLRIVVPKNGNATMNFLLSGLDTPADAQTIRALVHVLNGGKSDKQPSVTFVNRSGAKVPTKIARPTSEEMSELGLGDQENAWYWASPVERLAPGVYHAQSSLEGYFDDETLEREVADQGVEVFHLSLQPRMQLGKLAGYVVDQATGQAIPNATIEFMSSRQRPQLTSAKGVYGPIGLPQGDYVVVASASGYLSQAVTAQVQQGRNTRADIKLKKAPEQESDRARAFVTVLKTPGCVPPEPPAVRFVRKTGGQANIQNEVLTPGLLTQMSSSEYADIYLAVPALPLAAGQYQVAANLASYDNQTSITKSIGNTPVVFELTLEHRPDNVPVAFYGWRDTPDQSSKLARVLELQNWVNRNESTANEPTYVTVTNELSKLRQESLRGVDVLVWSEENPWNWRTVSTHRSISLRPGYWWYMPLLPTGSQASEPERITVSCFENAFDFTVSTPNGNPQLGTAYVVVRAKANDGQLLQSPAPDECWLAPVGVDGTPDLDEKIDLTIRQSLIAKNGLEAWFWLGSEGDALPPGRYLAFAGRTADSVTDRTFGTIEVGSTTVFRLSLEDPGMQASPSQLAVAVTLDSPNDIPQQVRVIARNESTQEARVIPAVTRMGSLAAGIPGQWFQATLPAGVWEVEAFADGFETVDQPFPVHLSHGDRETTEVVLARSSSIQPEPVKLEALVRVERLQGSDSVPKPNVNFLFDTSTSEASVSRAPAELLSTWGITQDMYPNSEWFVAVPSSPSYAQTVRVDGGLAGYQSASEQKAVLAGLKSHFLLELLPTKTMLEALVVNAYDGQPVPNIEISLTPPAGQAAAYSQNTDQQGISTIDLKHGEGTYQVHIAGASLEKELDLPIVIRSGENSQKFEVTLPETANNFIVFGSVQIRESIEEIQGQSMVTVEKLKKVSGVKVVLEPINGAVLPGTTTTLQSTVEGFEFQGLSQGEYVVTASHPGRNSATKTARVSIGTGTNRFGPIDLLLEVCDGEYETLLDQIVTAGWNNLPKAEASYKLAKQRVADCPRADYAMALTYIQNNKYASAKKYLANVIRLRNQDPMWDRASEAYVWIDLAASSANSLRSAVSSMEQVQRIYANRNLTNGSGDTARLLGVGAGMLQGPWKRKTSMDGEDLGNRLTSGVTPALADDVRNGIEEVLSRFKTQTEDLAASEEQDKERADEIAQEKKRQAEESLSTLQAELDQIRADVENRRAEADQILQLATQEALPLKQEFEIKRQFMFNGAQRLNALIQELNSIVPAGGNEPMGGFDNGGGFGNPGGGGGGGFGGSAMLETKPKQDQIYQIPEHILGQIQNGGSYTPSQLNRMRILERQILTLRTELTAREAELAPLNAAIVRIETRYEATKREFNNFLRGKNIRATEIERDMAQIQRALSGPNGGQRTPKSAETRSLEEDLQELATYYSFPLEQRRTEFRESLGCGAGAASDQRQTF